jgi:predicted CoA-substrate-specific enzyme activase
MLTAGLDIGSTACKAVIMKDGEQILARAVVALGTGTGGARQVFHQVMADSGTARSDIRRMLLTGYGRFSFDDADNQMSEVSCHAKGIRFLLPTARTVIDVGGQDIKVLRLSAAGVLENFVMNDKCAAGTGRFLDVMASVMDVTIEELSSIAETAKEEVSISNTCTVFAESEVISKMSAGVALPDLAAGIHTSVAKRVASLAFRNGLVKDVAMSGGVALNKSVVKALGRELDNTILVHSDCQMAGAIGAALFAWRDLVSGNDSSKKQAGALLDPTGEEDRAL